MKVSGVWISNPAAQQIIALLNRAGHKAYFVGGCVRNSLMGLPVADVDIAASARPEEVLALAQEAGIKSVPTGISHGTVTLVAGGVPFEVTTFRNDVSTDGRRAVVSFSDNIVDDAARRDFTVNALYAGPDGTVLDPLGALADLRQRRIVFIGDANARIREDYLRILRFFRMLALYGDPARPPDQTALQAIAGNLGGINQLSKERVTHEMRLLLGAENPSAALAAMAECGALETVLPGAVAAPMPALVRLEEELDAAPDWLRRLALLGAADPAGHLRMARGDMKHVADIARAAVENGNPAQLAQRFGSRAALSASLIGSAKGSGAVPGNLMEDLERGASARFPVGARDLQRLGFSGPELGSMLHALREAWIASDMQLSRSQLLSDFAKSR